MARSSVAASRDRFVSNRIRSTAMPPTISIMMIRNSVKMIIEPSSSRPNRRNRRDTRPVTAHLARFNQAPLARQRATRISKPSAIRLANRPTHKHSPRRLRAPPSMRDSVAEVGRRNGRIGRINHCPDRDPAVRPDTDAGPETVIWQDIRLSGPAAKEQRRKLANN